MYTNYIISSTVDSSKSCVIFHSGIFSAPASILLH